MVKASPNLVTLISADLVKVMRVEGGLEADDDEDEGREHGGRVKQLQLLLSLTAEQAINQGA